MGKRKERRLAAKIGAGRRVKLDLFAEPSGDLGDSSAKDEDGKDVDAKPDPELPNSPSSSGGFCRFSSKGFCREGMSKRALSSWNMECRVAVVLGTFIGEISPALPCHSDIVNVFLLVYVISGSIAAPWRNARDLFPSVGGEQIISALMPVHFCVSGQPPENPLSLLGQYSDDDMDDRVDEVVTNSDDDKQAKNYVEPLEEGEIAVKEEHSSQKSDNLDVERDSSSVSPSSIAEVDVGRQNVVSLSEKVHEVNVENQGHVVVASDTKTVEGMSSVWKMVLHEESNRYYYWNIATGETSWDVPDGLAAGTETLGAEMKVTAASDVNAPAAFGATLVDFSASQGVVYSSGTSDMNAMYEPGALVNHSLEHSQVDGSQFHGGLSVVGGLPYQASSLGQYPLSMQLNASGGNLVAGSYQGHDFSAFSSEQWAVDLPSHLVKNGEALLERLKLLQGSGTDSTEHGWLSKYMSEIEIRLSDIRCLLPYGSSLVPFWVHSERQFSQLENAINTEIGEQHNKVSVLHASAEEGKKTNLEIEGDARVDADMRKLFPENSVSAVHDMGTSAAVQKAVYEPVDGGILNVQQTSLQDLPAHQRSENKGDKEINGDVVHGETSPNPDFQSSEDVDMDVDMEIEDQSPAVKSSVDVGGQFIASSGQLVQSCAPISGICQTPESELIIPPPPQEEWIPPPPPDEGIPPPPPDEPPESLCPPPPPPEPEPVPSIYSEQHNSFCIDPNVSYYGNTVAESLGTSFYEHTDVSQIAALTPPSYYAAMSNPQPTTVLNPLDSVAYHAVPNGAMPVAPAPSTVESSDSQAASGCPNYDTSYEHVVTVGAVMRDSFLSKQIMDPLAPKTDVAQTQVSSDSVASAPASVSTKEYASAPCYSATAASVTGTSTSVAVSGVSASVSKVQSKASRMKKPKVAVASSLRSNKKVSSMVDKWKAAKEELQEGEKEERVTPLEALEKKKQREIEGWRAQQIASGEAKENANFQPLGGDWRERVKRKRAQKEASLGTTSDAAVNETKQPDLHEHSRDLPPGWQAYWDDSSKQVYYANSITSETTWIRPAR
ncbi:Formin-binding protein 4 [Bienertia sinuspersici]